jgi:hypothetical protein
MIINNIKKELQMNYILLENDEYPFSVISTLKHIKIDEDINPNEYFKSKFGKEDGISLIYEGIPIRIMGGKITFYEKNMLKGLKFISELTEDYRKNT